MRRRPSVTAAGSGGSTASPVDTALLLAMLAGSTLARPSLPGLEVAANNLVVPLCAGALAWRARATLWEVLARHRLLLAATLALYLWVWISALLGEAPSLSMRLSAKYGAYAFVFVCLLLALHRPPRARRALRAVHAALVVLAMLAVLEVFAPRPFEQVRGPLLVPTRVASLLVWPNQLGVLSAVALALGAAAWRARWLAPWWFATSLPILLAASALSGSRNGWFVLGAALVLLVWMRVLRPLQSAAIGVLFLLALVTFPISTAQLGLRDVRYLPLSRAIAAPPALDGTTTPVETMIPRLALWKAAVREIRQHPLSGIGLEVFANSRGPAITGQHWINTHNLALNVAVELGLVGLALCAAWLVALYRSGDPSDATTALPLLALGLGQLFDCFIYDYTFMTCAALFAACYASRLGAAD